jgi:hypothetical protein
MQNDITRPPFCMVFFGNWLVAAPMNLTKIDVEYTKSFINVSGIARPAGAKFSLSFEPAMNLSLNLQLTPIVYSTNAIKNKELHKQVVTQIIEKTEKNNPELAGKLTNFSKQEYLIWQDWIKTVNSVDILTKSDVKPKEPINDNKTSEGAKKAAANSAKKEKDNKKLETETKQALVSNTAPNPKYSITFAINKSTGLNGYMLEDLNTGARREITQDEYSQMLNAWFSAKR